MGNDDWYATIARVGLFDHDDGLRQNAGAIVYVKSSIRNFQQWIETINGPKWRSGAF